MENILRGSVSVILSDPSGKDMPMSDLQRYPLILSKMWKKSKSDLIRQSF